ncbi:MAG: ABC transporter ATP-binding protein [Anaerovoracaceae bacterium]
MKLNIVNLKKNFEKKEVLKDVNFSFSTGKIYGLLGKNGAGKTTLFNCINEDLPIDGGSVTVVENEIERKVTSDDIGYVLSTPVVPEFLTGREFLKFFIDINRDKIKGLKSIDEYFSFMDIDVEDRDKLMKDYSHGMKNKMQLLINIIASPGILLLDEPLTSFDVLVAEEMKELLKRIKSEHIIVFSTHIMDLAVSLCDEIVILNNGVLEEIDNTELTEAGLKERVIQILKGEENVRDL